MEETNGGGKSYKDKLHEPILNPIQVFILLGIIIFEVVTNILPLLMGMDINPIWVMVTMTGGIAAFAVTSLLRAAYPGMMNVAKSILDNDRSMEAEKDLLSIKKILDLIPGTK